MKLVRLFAFPLVCLLSLSLTVLWSTGGEITRSNYWSIQVDWFAATSQALLQWRVFFENITQLGDALILLPMVSPLLIWRPQILAGFLGAIPLGVLLSSGGKYLAAVPRPSVVLDPAIYTAVGGITGYHSLPSGHTITIFTAMTVILLVLIPNPQNKIHYSIFAAGLLSAAFIAFSRVAIGVHWPLDIVTGAALGYLAGVSGVLLTQYYQRWWYWFNTEKYPLVFGTILLVWSVELFKQVFKYSDSNDIVIWIAAIFGLITSLYLLKNSVAYYLRSTVLGL